jgi:hypothetical protein
VLYWFRTPPGVKVGRAALDEEAIRLIEQLNPGIEFDWTRILKGQGAPAPESRSPVETRRQRPDTRRPPPPAPSRAVQPPVAVAPVGNRAVEPSSIAAEPDAARESERGGPPEELPGQGIASAVPTPAHAKLGPEGVERLRARYAEILARISERAADAQRREELKGQADRLNPDSWVTADEVVQGLEQYESVFASLREVVGQRRRRRRRGSRPQAEPSEAGLSASDSAETESSAGVDAAKASDSLEGPEPPESDAGDGDSNPGES